MDVDRAQVLSHDNVDRFLLAAQDLGPGPVLPVPITTLRDTATLRDWHHSRHVQTFGLRAPRAAGSRSMCCCSRRSTRRTLVHAPRRSTSQAPLCG